MTSVSPFMPANTPHGNPTHSGKRAAQAMATWLVVRRNKEVIKMSNIKETATRPEVSPLAGKDLQLAKQQIEMEAGQAMLRETAKTFKAQKEQIDL